MDNVYPGAYLAIEVLEAVLNNADGRNRNQRFVQGEVSELVRCLFQNNDSIKVETDHLSYIGLVLDGLSYDEIIPIIVDAKQDIIPVLLDGGNGFVPNSYEFLVEKHYSWQRSRGWKQLPGYGEVKNLFPCKPGYKPWFGVFSDTTGVSLYFYYPENPSGVIEIPYEGVDLGGFRVYWRHGIPGLSKILQVIYFEWLVRIYSYGVM
nr:hypothetical protein [Endozoicomonas sp.]